MMGGMLEHRLADAAYARVAAYERQGGYCLRCHAAMPLGAFEAHHRQRRDTLGWCPCNVVALHPRCHTQGPRAVHSNPVDAATAGLIVGTAHDPRLVPVLTFWPWHAWVLLRCDGTIETDPTLPLP